MSNSNSKDRTGCITLATAITSAAAVVLAALITVSPTLISLLRPGLTQTPVPPTAVVAVSVAPTPEIPTPEFPTPEFPTLEFPALVVPTLEFPTLEPPIPAANSSGWIENVWLEHNIIENEQLGMLIHTKFHTENMQDSKGTVNAYFYFSDSGIALKDFNSQYSTNGGNVSAFGEFTPLYFNTDYDDYIIFIPYSELHMIGIPANIRVSVQLMDVSRNEFISNPYDVTFDYSGG